MNILEILRNPLVKGIGIVLILYFALFANKEHPKSLGNRLSSENLKKDLAEVKDRGEFIVTNVKMAREMTKNSALQPTPATQNPAVISVEDLDAGNGELILSCGDEAEIAYGIYTKEGQQLEFINSEKITIGSNSKVFLEKNLTGMKQGGIRYINIPQAVQTLDQKIDLLLKKHNSDLKIQVTLVSFAKSTANISCN